MTKKLYEIDMQKIAKPVGVSKKVKKVKKVPVAPVEEVEEHPVTGGKSLATLELIKADVAALKKVPTEAQLAARQRNKEKREAKKAEEKAEAQRILDENARKEKEAAALLEAKSLKRKEKAAERKKAKEAEAAKLTKPLDQTPPAPVAVSIKNEGKKKYAVPEVQYFKPSSVEPARRAGVWAASGGKRRLL